MELFSEKDNDAWRVKPKKSHPWKAVLLTLVLTLAAVAGGVFIANQQGYLERFKEVEVDRNVAELAASHLVWTNYGSSTGIHATGTSVVNGVSVTVDSFFVPSLDFGSSTITIADDPSVQAEVRHSPSLTYVRADPKFYTAIGVDGSFDGWVDSEGLDFNAIVPTPDLVKFVENTPLVDHTYTSTDGAAVTIADNGTVTSVSTPQGHWDISYVGREDVSKEVPEVDSKRGTLVSSSDGKYQILVGKQAEEFKKSQENQ